MDNDNKLKDLKKKEKEDNKNTSQPDPETLGKTDPQENMKGPLSSLMNNAKDEMEENDEKDNEDEKNFNDKKDS